MKSIIIFTSLMGLAAPGQSAIKMKSIPEDGHLEFLAIGRPAMIRIKGDSATAPDGKIEINDKMLSGEFTFSIKNLSTGIDMRDKHMKEKYLEIDKHPQAKLILKNQPLQDLEKSLSTSFHGQLEFHGATKPVDGTISYEPSGHMKKAHAEFKVNLKEFNIEIPSYMGISVAEDVQVKIDLKMKSE